jgi:predicted HicB family RNase H-like nuclease
MDLVRFPVRLPPDVLEELKKSAKWSGISVSAYACQILTKHARESVGFAGAKK